MLFSYFLWTYEVVPILEVYLSSYISNFLMVSEMNNWHCFFDTQFKVKQVLHLIKPLVFIIISPRSVCHTQIYLG